MKTFFRFFSLLLFLSVNFSFAQVPYRASVYHPDNDVWTMQSHQKRFLKSPDRGSYVMTMDYGIAENDTFGFRFEFNSDFTAADTSLNYCAVTFDEIAGYLDETDPYGSIASWSLIGLPSKYPSGLALTVDSIFFVGGHENNSGNYDHFNLQLVTAGSTGIPSSNVVFEWNDSTNESLSPSGNWLGTNSGFVIGVEAAYTAAAGQKLSVILNYHDPSKVDSLGITAVYHKNSQGKAAKSLYKNSFTRYPPFLPNIVKNSDITYTAGTPPVTYNYEAQNWKIFLLTHFDYNVGINDNFDNLTLQKVFPVPANDESKLSIDLKNKSDVKVEVLNLSGRKIADLFEGNLTAGHHVQHVNTSELASGMYLISVKAGEGNPVISKLVVSH